MYPHRIRLRGPWECEALEPAGSPPRRVTLPCRWEEAGLADYRGMARLTRKFGFPGKADLENEHIWITGSGCSGCREVHLNDQLFADEACPSFAFDVTSIMQDRNRLDLLFDGSEPDVSLAGEVALEIRRAAYLAGIEVTRRAAGLRIKGRAIGLAPQALELYTLVDNRSADYRTIVPVPDGQAFTIDLAEIAPESRLLRLELVHVSTVWYRAEVPIPCWNS